MSESDAYELIIPSEAKDDLRKIDKAAAQRILKKMVWVAQNAAAVDHEALTGDWNGLFRWRIGDYRVIYKIDHDTKIITVAVIGHRRDVYDE